MLLRIERNAKLRKANKQHHGSELTDSSVRILACYPVPPLPDLDASRDAFVPVQSGWLDVIEESAPAEISSHEAALSQERKRTASPGAWRGLGYALVGSVFCAALGWNIADGQLGARASSWTHTTVSTMGETWTRISEVMSVPAPRARLGVESSASTLLLCEEPTPSSKVPAMMSEALEESAAMQSVLSDEAEPLMSEATPDGTTEPMLTPASEELTPASEELTRGIKRQRQRRQLRSHADVITQP